MGHYVVMMEGLGATAGNQFPKIITTYGKCHKEWTNTFMCHPWTHKAKLV